MSKLEKIDVKKQLFIQFLAACKNQNKEDIAKYVAKNNGLLALYKVDITGANILYSVMTSDKVSKDIFPVLFAEVMKLKDGNDRKFFESQSEKSAVSSGDKVYGATALLTAVTGTNAEKALALLEYYQDAMKNAGLKRDAVKERIAHLINIPDNNGMTPLHDIVKSHAVKNDKNNLLKIFIKLGADINAKDNDGKTPAHYALKVDDLNPYKPGLSITALIVKEIEDTLKTLEKAGWKNPEKDIKSFITKHYENPKLAKTKLNEAIADFENYKASHPLPAVVSSVSSPSTLSSFADKLANERSAKSTDNKKSSSPTRTD